jgi:hypothetical protein
MEFKFNNNCIFVLNDKRIWLLTPLLGRPFPGLAAETLPLRITPLLINEMI